MFRFVRLYIVAVSLHLPSQLDISINSSLLSSLGLCFAHRRRRAPVERLLDSIVVAILLRSMFKVICDFTGLIQFRHPNELGGMLWTLNTVLAHCISFASVNIYLSFNSDVPDSFARTLKAIVFTLVGAWFIIFALLLKVSKGGKWRTFLDTRSGSASRESKMYGISSALITSHI